MCSCVCLCVCLFRLLKDQRRASKSFYRLLVMDFISWICKIMLRSRVMVDLLTWNAFSEQCEAKLVHVVLLFYLVVRSALER